MIGLLRKLLQRSVANRSLRYYAATKAENEAARAMAIRRRLELAVAVCHLTDDQRRRAIQQAKRGRG